MQMREWRSVIGGADANSYSIPGRGDDKAWQFSPGPYEGMAVLFRPTREPLRFQRDPAMGWHRFIKGGLEIENIPEYHRTLIFRPSNRLLAERLNFRLKRSQQTADFAFTAEKATVGDGRFHRQLA